MRKSRKTSAWFIIFVIAAAFVALATALNLYLSLQTFFDYYANYTSQTTDKATLDYYMGMLVKQQLLPSIVQTIVYLSFVALFGGLASISQKISDFVAMFNSDDDFSEEDFEDLDNEATEAGDTWDYSEESAQEASNETSEDAPQTPATAGEDIPDNITEDTTGADETKGE